MAGDAAHLLHSQHDHVAIAIEPDLPPAARGPIPRPCATDACASATSIPPGRDARSPALPGSSTPSSAAGPVPPPAQWPGPGPRRPIDHVAKPAPTRSYPDLDVVLRHEALRLLHGQFAVVKNAGCKHCIGLAPRDAVDQMLQIADATAGDNRNFQRFGEGAREFQIEAGLVPSRSMLVSRISPAPERPACAFPTPAHPVRWNDDRRG